MKTKSASLFFPIIAWRWDRIPNPASRVKYIERIWDLPSFYCLVFLVSLSWIFASITDLSSIHPQIILNLSNNDVDVLWASSCIILHSSRNMSHTHTTAHVEFTHNAARVQISSIYNLCFMILLRPIVIIAKYTPELTLVAKLMNCLAWEREALTFDVFFWSITALIWWNFHLKSLNIKWMFSMLYISHTIYNNLTI